MLKEKKFALFKMLLFIFVMDNDGNINNVFTIQTNKITYFLKRLLCIPLIEDSQESIEKGSTVILARSITSYEKI